MPRICLRAPQAVIKGFTLSKLKMWARGEFFASCLDAWRFVKALRRHPEVEAITPHFTTTMPHGYYSAILSSRILALVFRFPFLPAAVIKRDLLTWHFSAISLRRKPISGGYITRPSNERWFMMIFCCCAIIGIAFFAFLIFSPPLQRTFLLCRKQCEREKEKMWKYQTESAPWF